MKPSIRRYELDWLRVLAILGVFLYHSWHFFDDSHWHVKNPVVYPGLEPLMSFFEGWGIPLLFVISGASTYYALNKRTGSQFLKDRTLRLLVPLLVGIFTHAIWQVYLERLTHNEFSGSFAAFVPHYFRGLYGLGGNFAWMGMHLWYLEMLFIFSLTLLPLLVWCRRGAGQHFLTWMGDRLAFPGGIYLMALPVIFVLAAFPITNILTITVFGGWSFATCLFFFLNGFLLVSHERLYDSVRRLRWLSLIAGIVLGLLLDVLEATLGEVTFGSAGLVLMAVVMVIGSWSWLLAILGFSAQHLRFPVRLLGYANEAVLPFYILHQTIMLTLGLYFVQLPIPDLLKWVVIVVTTFVVCMALYEFLIRRTNILRFLFGIKPLAGKPIAQTPKAISAH
jgi:peptidoglycan/LPS O-acetylase OafA/YrhL